MSPAVPPSLRFAWWNVHDFAHFDENRAGEIRWPLVRAEYDAKCERVDAALRHLIATNPPDILGLGEITTEAAEAIRARLLPEYQLDSPDVAPGATLQVAVLFRSRSGFRPRLPLIAIDVPRTTRGMSIVDHLGTGHCVRFVFCHWTAFGENSDTYRERLAESVSRHAYEFVNDSRKKSVRHVVVVGDLNVEPFSPLFQTRLHASRDRERARQRRHASDRDVRRVRFYNPTWRLLGERHAHDPANSAQQWAGTYYNAGERAWHTYDQVLVTGDLLGSAPPYFDEASFGIAPLPGCLAAIGRPEAFGWAKGVASGLSDHLPLTGRIVLPPG